MGDSVATLESDSSRPDSGYEYLDHTADVQLHSWGGTLRDAFEQVAVSMYGYMTELSSVQSKDQIIISASGRDLETLLYGFLDECLYNFCAEPNFVANSVEIIDFDRWRNQDDEEDLKITARLYGETFDLSKHPQGTEVKAITYSAMQINEKVDFSEIFVIIDI